MDLSRAIGKFAQSTVYGWDSVALAWEDTALRGRLQVYDKFISEREFGQRKRILTLAGDQTLPADYGVVRLGNTATVYIVEGLTNDVEGDEAYGTVLSLHEAPFAVQICRDATEPLASGGKRKTGATTVLHTTWVNISRYSSVDSKEFANTDYTIYTVYFPRGLALDTDMYVKRVDTGEILDITELFQTLSIPAARCQARG